jgi:hypothetical protein
MQAFNTLLSLKAIIEERISTFPNHFASSEAPATTIFALGHL